MNNSTSAKQQINNVPEVKLTKREHPSWLDENSVTENTNSKFKIIVQDSSSILAAATGRDEANSELNNENNEASQDKDNVDGDDAENNRRKNKNDRRRRNKRKAK